MKEKIKNLSSNPKYFNTLKYLVHMTESKEKRHEILELITQENPSLCARIIMTICNDIREEENNLKEAVVRELQVKSDGNNLWNLMLALFELGEYDLFMKYFTENIRSIKLKHISKMIVNLGVEQKLIFANLLVGQKKYVRYISPIIEELSVNDINEYETDFVEMVKSVYRINPFKAHKILEKMETDYLTRTVFYNAGNNNIEKELSKENYKLERQCELEWGNQFGLHDNINNIATWKKIYDSLNQNESWKGFCLVIRTLYLDNQLNREVLEKILIYSGLKISIDDSFNIDKCLLELNRRKILEIEPFKSLILDEKEMLSWIHNHSNDNNYKFGDEYINHIDVDYIDNVLNYPCKLFDECVKKYTKPEYLLKVYFNSPLKMVVSLDYLFLALIERYGYDAREIKHLLLSYPLTGIVCEVKPYRFKMEPLNFWLIGQSQVRNPKGKKEKWEKGDVVYLRYSHTLSTGNVLMFHGYKNI